MNSKLLAIALGALLPIAAAAQDDGPLEHGRMALVGYGDANYIDGDAGNGAFSAKFVPIFLYQINDRLHLEAEVEFSFSPETGESETEVEYADMHFYFTDTSTITVGKFMLPFAQFGPNLHPSWINRLPTMPGIYGGHGGHGGGDSLMTGLIPVLKDVGLSINKTFAFGGNQKLLVDLYAVNGVGLAAADAHGDEGDAGHDDGAGEHEEEEGHAGEEEEHAGDEEEHADDQGDHAGEDDGHAVAMPEVSFERGNGDNNNNKAFGGRIAYAFLPRFELGYSFYQARYDDAGDYDFRASAVDVSWLGTYVALRGEYIKTDVEGMVEVPGHDPHDPPTMEVRSFERDGWYLQASWQLRSLQTDFLNPVELVVRYSRTGKLDEAKRKTFGINYWLTPSTAMKLAVDDTETNDGRDQSRVFMQFTYGF